MADRWATMLWFLAPKSLQVGTTATKSKDTPWKKSYDKPRQHVEKQRDYFADKGQSSQSYDFSSSQVWRWKLDYKESWVLKNWCFLKIFYFYFTLQYSIGFAIHWHESAMGVLLNCGAGEDSWGVPWTARRSNQSILKESSPEYSLEGLMLKLKLQ